MSNPRKGLIRNLIFFSNFLTEKIEEVLNHFDLTHSEYLVLRYIYDFEGTTQYDAAKKLRISIQRCNQLVRSLAEKALIRKNNILKGKLVKKELFITEEGSILIEQIFEELFVSFESETLPSEELIILNLTLQKLNAYIQKKNNK